MTDFTIIGSGAGGSAAALELLENNYSVEIFEEGNHYNHEKMNMLEGLQSLWRNNGINLFFGKPMMNFGEGKAVGGSTIINGGVIAHTSEKILKLWDDSINENFFSNDEFFNICNEIKNKLVPQNQFIDNNKISCSSEILLKAANLKNFITKPTNLAFKEITEKHNSPFGCISGLKNSLDKNYHLLIKKHGGIIESNSKVVKVIPKGNVIKKIILKNIFKNENKEIEIKNLILSAGPTQTPKIILNNKLSNFVNKLNFHMNLKILCYYDTEISSYKSSLLTHHVREFENDGVLFMASNYIKPLIASFLNFHNSDEIKELMSKYKQGTVFNCQIQPNFSSANIKKINGFQDIKITWKLDKRDFLKIKKYLRILTELIFISGAKKVLLPIDNSSEIFTNIDKALKVIENLKENDLEITSVHAMSSCSMSSDEKNLIDNFGALKNFENVYLMDSSLMPSNTGQHPQLTIMALVKKLIQKNIENNKFKV
tara:strand:- start:5042 stop:6496 length:1455 start_codon:yes stop_codon:yes gene_type:complete